MTKNIFVLVKFLLFFVWTLSSIKVMDGAKLDLTGIVESESNFNSSLGLVLSDLSAEIAARNQTFISQKIAQIRAKKLRLKNDEENNSEDDSKIRTKFEKRLKRIRMKKKCVTMTRKFKGSGKQIRRRAW
jgi:hypothetical protein